MMTILECKIKKLIKLSARNYWCRTLRTKLAYYPKIYFKAIIIKNAIFDW